MRIHHLNCISSCPLGGWLMDGRSRSPLQRGRLCCHCLLLEGERGLTLVDTGFGLNDIRHPDRLSRFFLTLLSPDFREEMTAVRQVERLGFKARDVRDIVLTHLDFDHAGGLDDFPGARVHMLAAERDYAVRQKTWLDRQRFRPAQWGSRDQWQVHPSSGGEKWYGFDCVRDVPGLSSDVLMIPLPGHTFGHAGIAVRKGSGWLLLAGDAYFHHREMDPLRPGCTPGLRLYQTMMEKDRALRLLNQHRLRQLKKDHGVEVDVFSAHDVAEFERLAGRAAGVGVDGAGRRPAWLHAVPRTSEGGEATRRSAP